MKQTRKSVRGIAILAILILMAQSLVPALAADREMEKELIGRWACPLETEESTVQTPVQANLAFLNFEEDGTFSLVLSRRNGEYAFTCEGTWTFEYEPEMNDHIRLNFTSTDDPEKAGEEYAVESVYDAYTESWVEEDTLYIALIMTSVSSSGETPFEDVYGKDEAWEMAFYREQGPNMKVVNCKEYVSLRKKASAASARLVRVPLGAVVLAFPEYGEQNGFIFCIYHGQEGYILSQYLEMTE